MKQKGAPKRCRSQILFALTPIEKDSGNPGKPFENAVSTHPYLYWFVMAVIAVFILLPHPVFAATVWTEFSKIMRDVYDKLIGISTIVAVTASACALLVRMISRNQRAVDEASSWLKRILVTWVILNTLGFFVTYLQPLIQGGRYTGS
ncbi:MAG: hypothetical protein LBL26_09400 [Peptococcaceae bacterium]|jgi:hypothetical protein|nr:hypothetical protein [Peptococcaceae bacterium]